MRNLMIILCTQMRVIFFAKIIFTTFSAPIWVPKSSTLNAFFSFPIDSQAYSLKFRKSAPISEGLIFFLLCFRQNKKLSFFSKFPHPNEHPQNYRKAHVANWVMKPKEIWVKKTKIVWNEYIHKNGGQNKCEKLI